MQSKGASRRRASNAGPRMQNVIARLGVISDLGLRTRHDGRVLVGNETGERCARKERMEMYRKPDISSCGGKEYGERSDRVAGRTEKDAQRKASFVRHRRGPGTRPRNKRVRLSVVASNFLMMRKRLAEFEGLAGLQWPALSPRLDRLQTPCPSALLVRAAGECIRLLLPP